MLIDTWNSLTKEVKDLHGKSFQSPKKETEKNTGKWKDTPGLCNSRISIVEIAILPNAIHRFRAIPAKIPKTFFTKIEENHPKTHEKPEPKRPWVKGRSLERLLCQTSRYRTVAMKEIQHWHANKRVDQQDKADDPNVSPRNYSRLLLTTRPKTYTGGKTASSTNSAGNGCFHEEWN